MHPLFRMDHNFDTLCKATDYAVQIGDPETIAAIKADWAAKIKGGFETQGSRKNVYYAQMPENPPTLSLKCNFLKINDCVLLLLSNCGDFIARQQLKRQAREWLGNPDDNAITSFSQLERNPIWNQTISSEETVFPHGARCAVILEDECQRGPFIEAAARHATTLKKSFSLMPIIDLKQIQLEKHDYIANEPLDGVKHPCMINGFIVTFYYPAGNFGDRKALSAKGREWFPKAKMVISQKINELFGEISRLNPSDSCRTLIRNLNLIAPPHIDFDESTIPDIAVSSLSADKEEQMETYYQERNPSYQSPQRLLRHRYLVAALEKLEDSVLDGIATKLAACESKYLIAEFDELTVIVSGNDEGFDIDLNPEEPSALSIQFLYRKNLPDIGTYKGKLPELVALIEEFRTCWDITELLPQKSD